MTAEPQKDPSKVAAANARARALKPARRAEIARRAAEARWGAQEATHTGELHIGEGTIACAVLPDGTRLLSQRAVGRALGRGYGGKDWQQSEEEGGGKLPFFLTATALRPFISNDLLPLVTAPILYRHGKSGGVAHGVAATALPMICDVWLKARDAGVLNKVQLEVAQKADMLMRGLAHVGIVALVDEATGYQEVRDRQALQAILDQYLQKELAAWAKRFPDAFYKEMFRLRGWKWLSISGKRPGIVGIYTNDLVYERLAPGILKELEARNPKDEHGRRRAHHHRWLTEDVGHPALAQHLHAVIGLMRAAGSWDQFYRMMNRAFPKKGETLEMALDE